MIYTEVKYPVWANEEHTLINAIVTFDSIGEVPFTASPNDTEAHGVKIYNECVNGDYGTIGSFE